MNAGFALYCNMLCCALYVLCGTKRNHTVRFLIPPCSIQFHRSTLAFGSFSSHSNFHSSRICVLVIGTATTSTTEQPDVAVKYRGQSLAEQQSIDIAWKLLMTPSYKKLRTCIFSTDAEKFRFRDHVVNNILATDIFDPRMSTLRKTRWSKAFHEDARSLESCSLDGAEDMNRKATVVIEHIIQASDVAHTMQRKLKPADRIGVDGPLWFLMLMVLMLCWCSAILNTVACQRRSALPHLLVQEKPQTTPRSLACYTYCLHTFPLLLLVVFIDHLTD